MATAERSLFGLLFKHSDVLLAVGIMTVLTVMIIPLPPALLDVLLTLNITLSLVVLMVAMYITEPLQFSVFPGLLLIMTLYRLSLNVASTRLILGEAYAGHVIAAFGSFVVKGNYVVGFVIFLLLVVIQFVVITRGAQRIAEVAARFTLDAMPGKQMAIDADLNAGLIDDQEAKQRRKKIAREADFYGAMDGASKFVRGDAVAGLIITVINIFGGLVIGVLQKGMPLSQALQTYTLLTIGDGLVTQIPALIISTAAGLVVTRAASESNLGQDVTGQMLSQPRALYLVAGLLLFFGIAPGLPTLPFFILAVLAALVAHTAKKIKKVHEERIREEKAPEREEFEQVERYLQVDPIELEIGYGLIPLVDTEQGGDLLHRITMIRKQCAMELGIIIPPIRIRDNINLKPDEYLIKIRGAEVAKGEVPADRLLALNPGTAEEKIPGEETREPAFGLPALWIARTQKERAELAGYTVVEPAAVLATHLREVLKTHAHLILTRQDVQNLIDTVKKENPTVVEELIPNLLTVGQVQKVLQNLLREKVPIRDMVTVLETLADHAQVTKDTDVLTEYVRNAIAHFIYKPFVAEDGRIYALTLDPKLEGMITDQIMQSKGGGINLPPQKVKALYEELKTKTEEMVSRGIQPLVLCSPTVRPYFKKLIEPTFPTLAVLSYSELPRDIEIKSLAMVGSTDED